MSTHKLPDQAPRTLERAFGQNLDRAALEALAIEGYRSAKLTVGEVARVLGLSTSLAAQEWLAEHGFAANYSLDDLEADRESLQFSRETVGIVVNKPPSKSSPII